MKKDKWHEKTCVNIIKETIKNMQMRKWRIMNGMVKRMMWNTEND